MKRIQNGSKKGIAKVVVGNGKVVITFENDDPITLKSADVPKFVKTGKWYVTMNAEENEILAVRPINALSKAKFSHFPTQEEGELPAPFEKQGGSATRKDGTKFSYEPYLAFNTVIKLISKEYDGMTVPVFMRYLFVNDGDGNVAIKGGGKNADILESFLEVTGVFDTDIPYSDNILPRLQKRILKADRTFNVMIKDSYADSFLPLDDDLDATSDDDDPDEPVEDKVDDDDD